MNKKRQTVRDRGFVLALVGGLLLAAPASAQEINVNQTDPFSATLENPCVPEFVPVEGFRHTDETTSFEEDGTVEFKADNEIAAAGVGNTTMVDYEFDDRLKIDIIFDPAPGPVLIRTKVKLVADGDIADYFVTSVFTVSGDGQQSTSTFEEECRRAD